MINIRVVDMGDYPQLIDLWRNTENIGLSDADSPVNLDAFLQRNPGLSFVALENDRIIGAVLGGHDGRRGAIYHLAVGKDFRGKGTGKQLLNHVMNAFAEIGIERCHIHVYENNQFGLDFWQKNGWFKRPELVLLSKDISRHIKIRR